MTLEWIAARLFMGAPTHVASLLHHQERKVETSEETLFWLTPFQLYGLLSGSTVA
jgi:hypothetical protein